MRFALGLMLVLSQPSTPVVDGSISGIVISAITGEPVPGAGVTLIGPPAIESAQSTTIITDTTNNGSVRYIAPDRRGEWATTTGRDGSFSFKGLKPGTYRIATAANGFVGSEYPPRKFLAPETGLSLTAAQNISNLSIKMTRTGTVTGYIADDLGLPAVDIPVQLLRVIYGSQGRALQSVRSTTADDRGIYRLYGITPGRYYLNIGNAPGPNNRLRPGGAPNPNVGSSPGYAYTYYRGVGDISDAATIDVKSGVEFVADMTASRQSVYTVRGRLIDSRTGQPPQSATLSLNYRSLNGGGSIGGNFYDPRSGNFEIRNVIPGQYIVQGSATDAGAQNPVRVPAPPGGVLGGPTPVKSSFTGGVPVRVVNADVDGLVVTLNPPMSLAGRLSVEGGLITSYPNLRGIQVFLRTVDPGNVVAMAFPDTGTDGSFRFNDVKNDEYKISVLGPPPGFYLRRVDYEGTDVLTNALKIAGSTSGTLNVVLSPRPAELSGAVTDETMQPAQSAVVAIIPDQRDRLDLYKADTTDKNGRFAISGLAPGAYKLFSWESLESASYFDPDFLKKYDAQARPVRLDESSSATVDLRVLREIP